ncbi:GntR family transcriptional regulator [Microbacterium sp.]|uniref:GntR family transcriptional regulator n=1 Tax=Microbacterium sp. TaxID=51671 RepID=UPI00289E7A59|nr:GntR family transcriptional regulator [Microbacterium sp.]
MDVTSEIREFILAGDFAPNQRLVEADVAEQLGASRAAIREALGVLTGEGLIERVQNRGARVRAFTLSEAIEIAEVRRALESLCAGKAAERVTDDEIIGLKGLGTSMQDGVAAGDVLTYSAKNRELHALVRMISAQTVAQSLIERLRAQSVREQFRLAMKPGRPAVSVHEHQRIIDALCARDPAAAEAAMSEHLDSVIEAMRDVGTERRRP